MNGLMFQLNADKFSISMRQFFAPIIRFLYRLISGAIELMFDLSKEDFGLGDQAEKFKEAIFAFLIIFMIFKLTISILNYLVNPDSFLDKDRGFPKLIVRVVVSIVLLVSINPIFNLLYTVQDKLLTDNVVDSVLFSNSKTRKITYVENGESIEKKIYEIQLMDEACPHEVDKDGNITKSDYHFYTFSRGDLFAVQALRPFYTLNAPNDNDSGQVVENLRTIINDGANGYCGVKIEDMQDADGKIDYGQFMIAPHNTTDLLSPFIYNNAINEKISAGDIATYIIDKSFAVTTGVIGMLAADVKYVADNLTEESVYMVDFSYIWALIFGMVILLLLISFCFDVVIRAFTLFFYQLIAPIPIISNMSPNKKDADMLTNWLKKIGACWASLFVRIATLDFFLYMIDIILNKSTILKLNNSLIAQLFIIIGALMFAKKLPKLLEEIIPGLKLGGLQLNPFKRIGAEALGGKAVLGAGAAIGAAGLSAGANTITGIGRAVDPNTWKDKNGNITARSLLRGAANTAGSPVAGAVSAGRRAFMKTSKDGRIISGMTTGHLEAQFAKQQREDLERKGSTLSGRVRADANRWIGRYSEGQRTHMDILNAEGQIKAEKEKINKEKVILQNQRDEAIKDYKKLQANFKALNERLDSRKDVKDEIDKLEWMKTTDFSAEVETQKMEIEKQYETRIKLAVNPQHRASLQAEMERTKSSITADSIKEQKLSAQNDLINRKRSQYLKDVVSGQVDDQVASQIIDNISEIKKNNKDIANNSNFDLFADKDNTIYNKKAIYMAADQISTISNSFNNREQALNDQLYNVNIEEQKINSIKASAEYTSAMADLASRKTTAPQPENWLPSADVNAGSTTGYGGNQWYSRNGGGRPPGGGTPPPPPSGGGHH